MATKFGNVKGVKFIEEPQGANRGGVVLVTFDIVGGAVYTGGTDTLQLGSGTASQAYENGVLSTTALTLQTMIQNRRRDGRTVTLTQAMQGPAPGHQTAATNGPYIYVQSATLSSNNLQVNLFSASTSGSAITTTTAAWDWAATVVLFFTAGYTGASPE